MSLGDLAVELGELERAHALLDRAHAVHTALGLTLLNQYCALVRARLLFATRSASGISAALRQLAQVRKFADQNGIAWLRDLADALERRIAASPPSAFQLANHPAAQRARREDN
jgi:hypothetical protein